VQELEAICAGLTAADPNFQARITLGLTRHGYEISPDEKVVRTLVRSFERMTGFPPQFSGSSAWLDSAILGRAGIPTVIFGPHGSGAHADEEYVTLSSVISGARVLAQVMAEFCE
jgi:acetylornithine deacetylase